MNGQMMLALVQSYLDQAQDGAPGMSEEVLEKAASDFKDCLDRRFNQERQGDFTLRLSNLGRPACQLQMEKAGAPAEREPYNFEMKMLIGDLIEIAGIAILKGAGVEVDGEQEEVFLEIADRRIKGHKDLDIEGGIWDFKSASKWAFENKFSKGFSAVAEDDAFGYVGQGVGYSKGADKPFHGWIAVSKETGEWAFCEFPQRDAEVRELEEQTLSSLEKTIETVENDQPFERQFDDVAETFRGKPTGNRYLGVTCSFCSYKWTCWPGLEHRPQIPSSAKNPKWLYYTHIEESETDE